MTDESAHGRTEGGQGDHVAYDGNPLIQGVEIDGWRIGVLTGYWVDGANIEDDPLGGDAFLVAPDNLRAGIAWRRVDPIGFTQSLDRPVRAGRFGYFSFNTRSALTSNDAAPEFLAEILPPVRQAWRKVVRSRDIAKP